MKLIEYTERINLLNKLINEKRTGCPEKLSKRLKISKGRLYQLIEELRLLGAPICYSRNLETYFYANEFEIIAHLSLKPLNAAELIKTNAGFTVLEKNINFFTHSNFCRVGNANLALSN